MRFTITGLISPDASAGIDRIANPFADALRLQIAEAKISCSVQLLVYSPIIMAASLGTVQNETEHRRRQSAIVIFRNIDHPSWMLASLKERLRLYAGALSDGLGDVSREVLSAADLGNLRAAIDGAALEVDASLA
jgi:hypothetical protein